MATGDQADLFARIKALLPGWFGQDLAPTPVLDALLQAPAWALSFFYAQYVYAKLQTRITTATDGWLDLISQDFFGAALPRNLGESDASFLARIKANLFPASNTLAAISAAITAITGTTPHIIEPWRPNETGVWDGAAGQGAMFWDVDNITTPFRWTEARGEIFIEVPTPPLSILSNGALPAWDQQSFWDTYTVDWIDISANQINSASQIAAVVRQLKVCGVLALVKFTGVPGIGGAALWDGAGEAWDGSTPPRWDAL